MSYNMKMQLHKEHRSMVKSILLNTGMRYGIMLGLLSSIINAAIHFLNLCNYNEPFSATNIAILIFNVASIFIVFFFGLTYFKSKNGDKLLLGEGIILTLIIGSISAIILSIFTYFLMTYFSFEIGKEILESEILTLEEEENFINSLLSPTQIALSTFAERFVTSLFLGVISSLIVKST